MTENDNNSNLPCLCRELKSINASSAGMIADREQFKFSLRKRGLSRD